MAFYVPGEIPDVHSLHIDVMDDSLGTVAPSKVAFIAHNAMKQLIHQHPGMGDEFWRDTLIDAAIFREWIVNVESREAYSRIAHLLCEKFLKLKAVGLTNGPVSISRSRNRDSVRRQDSQPSTSTAAFKRCRWSDRA
jgi:hypothetical protein